MNLKDLAKRIKTKREEAQLTQRQLANSLQISYQAISKWERGENAPDILILPELASLLKVTTDWLLTGHQTPKHTFEATVFCTSLRGFAKEAETLSPKIVSQKVNHLFHQLTDRVLEKNGVPVKYVGDGFLAYFTGQNHAQRAVDVALQSQTIIDNDKLLISCHSGDIFLGTIGHKDFASLDIMGNTVNTVFFMNQWATEKDKINLLISKMTHDQLSEIQTWTQCDLTLRNNDQVKTIFYA